MRKEGLCEKETDHAFRSGLQSTLWGSEAFSAPDIVFSVWVYSALFFLLSLGILGA